MKTKFIIALLLLSTVCFSQIAFSGHFNYKAVIKDNGNLVTNQNVMVLFTISQDTGYGPTMVYQEEHSTTTDSNGIIILSIGTGTDLFGYFDDIVWGDGDTSLNTQVDFGSGYVDMGTTLFSAVPYALFAENANTTGLEALNEGSGQGWRLKGVEPNNYGPIGWLSVDLSNTWNPSTTFGATGNYATAVGLHTTASGQGSFASGVSTIASQTQSTAMGSRSVASGFSSTALGQGTLANAPNSTAIGILNVGGGDPLLASSTDPIFEIGNGYYSSGGTVENRRNAFSLLRNGNATLAGTLTQNSDRRLKTNITKLQYGLKTILKLNPVSYNWKKYPEQKKQSLGLIAQEVQPIINEIVSIGKDKDKTLSVSYIELIPVLIKAIQEQQDIIDKQESKIDELTSSLNELLSQNISYNKTEASNNVNFKK